MDSTCLRDGTKLLVIALALGFVGQVMINTGVTLLILSGIGVFFWSVAFLLVGCMQYKEAFTDE